MSQTLRPRRTARAAAFSVASLLSTPTSAQKLPVQQVTLIPADLGSVTVAGTGNRTDQQVGVSGPPTTAAQFAPSRPALDQTQPTSTISAETIQKTNVPIADYDDIVTLTPSAMNINPAGPGLQQDFGQSIRGLQYTEFSTLFDGIQIPGFPYNLSPQTGIYFLGRDFGSVTVNRGPGNASAVGNATFGGYLDLRSPVLTAAALVNPYATFGSFGTKFYGIEGQTGALPQLDGGRMMLDVTREEARGADTGIGTERRNLLFKWDQPVGPSTVVTLFVNADNTDTKTPYGTSLANIDRYGRNYSLNSDPTSQTSSDYNRDNYTTDFEYLGVRSDLGNGWTIDNKLYTTAYYQRDRHGMDPGGTAPNLSGPIYLNGVATNVTNDVPGFANQNDFRDYGDVLRLTKDVFFGQLRIGVWADGQNFTTNTYAVDFSRRAVAYTLAPGASPYTALYHSTLTTVQPYAEFSWTPLPNVTLDGGVKYSAVTRTLTGPVGLTDSATNDHAAYNRALPAFSANWRIRKDLSVYAQAGEGYLTPQLNLFSTTNVASVQPSTTWSYQVGTVYQRSWLSLGADLYDIDFNNVIVGNTVGTITTFANQGAASFRGVELEATVRLGHGFAVYANGTLNDSAYTTNGNNLAQTPRRTAAAALLYDRGRVLREGDEVFANLIAKSVSPQYGVDTQTPGISDQFPIKSYNQVDLNLGYVLPAYGHRIKVSMNASNLFDHRALTGYAGSTLEGEALYWTQAGRSLFFSVAAFF